MPRALWLSAPAEDLVKSCTARRAHVEVSGKDRGGRRHRRRRVRLGPELVSRPREKEDAARSRRSQELTYQEGRHFDDICRDGDGRDRFEVTV